LSTGGGNEEITETAEEEERLRFLEVDVAL
jgi:hypothetical protein